MKIIVTAVSSSLDAQVDPRFGRGAFFLIVDTETMQWEAFPNPGVNAAGGAGTMAAQFAAEKKANAVISGDFGPNASHALTAAGILMFLYKGNGSVRDAVELFKTGDLQQVNAPTAGVTRHSPAE